ncbi:MAG: diacylglycerol kinase family protein [Leptolyngbyaceae cyanobacterium MO_188.B28]|nr:diacylglycerol kinase family protein [Leptolyngbyaceae cyanobacterium MO_188.B28]
MPKGLRPNSAVNPSAKTSSSQDLSQSSSDQSLNTANPNRELSWKVASNLLVSFKYAWAGVSYAFITQRNFRIHIGVATLALSLSFLLKLSLVKISIITLTIGAVLTMELLNTALESVVDLTVQQSYHELAKIAKDCAAAAVLISALVAVLIAGLLIVPPLLDWVRSSLLFS